MGVLKDGHTINPDGNSAPEHGRCHHQERVSSTWWHPASCCNPWPQAGCVAIYIIFFPINEKRLRSHLFRAGTLHWDEASSKLQALCAGYARNGNLWAEGYAGYWFKPMCSMGCRSQRTKEERGTKQTIMWRKVSRQKNRQGSRVKEFHPWRYAKPNRQGPDHASNQPFFVQEVRPESCCIGQDFKNSFQSTVLARISCKCEQRCCISKTSPGVDLAREESITGPIITSSS